MKLVSLFSSHSSYCWKNPVRSRGLNRSSLLMHLKGICLERFLKKDDSNLILCSQLAWFLSDKKYAAWWSNNLYIFLKLNNIIHTKACSVAIKKSLSTAKHDCSSFILFIAPYTVTLSTFFSLPCPPSVPFFSVHFDQLY